jgi:hypothetical protein
LRRLAQERKRRRSRSGHGYRPGARERRSGQGIDS